MAQSYTRQSTFSDGDTITASLFNNEYNQLLNAFKYSATLSTTGHRHDGTDGQGGNIPQIGDLDFKNKIVVDSTNNRWGVFVEVSGTAVEQIRIQDGAIVPVTDSDIDLGTSSLEFKDLFLDGTAHIDTLDVDVNATIAGTLGVTGAATLSSTLAVTGAVIGSSTIQGTTITATTAFVPDASDGASLGTTSLEFSDLYLADGALIAFGDDQDVTLTHVADTGLLLNSTMALQFNDASQYINAPSATVLDINATDEIELNATLVDVNANLDVSGTVTATGTSVFASLDISGDIDVDGTANLDIVDIDGAVNIAAATTIATDNKIQFRDTAIYVNSSADGQLDIVADTEVQIAATTVDINGAVDISGNLDVGGNLVVTGTTTFNGGTLTLGDAASDNVVFGADVNSSIIPNTDATFDLGSSSQEWRDLYVDGTAYVDAINFNGTAISATAAELNILDGVTSTAAELNILDGVTSTAAELNILDGVTATAAEINILDGVTSTAAELNLLDGVTSTTEELNILDGVTASAADINLIDGITNGTVIASKAIITDANKDISGGRNITISGELDAGSLDISGDVDIDGTLEADAITIAGITLAETISDTVGAMVTSNTESGITVAYDDADNTLDFTVGTLNQDTTGNAATATALETARTIGGVSFDGTANITPTTFTTATFSGDVNVDSGVLFADVSANRVGINQTSPDVSLDLGANTDAVHVPVGTTAQRPGSAAAGYFRYNTSLAQFEGYTDAWGAIGGGGTNTFTHDVFTCNGSTTAFALSQSTESENNLIVFIDGVFQEQGAYSIATSSGTTTLTLSAAPVSGRKLVVYSVAAGVSGSNLNIDSMTGDGSDTTLTLSINPVNENNTQVFIDGVYQSKSNYSISGTTLTFSTAPPTGSAVEVMTMTQTEVNVPVDGTITSAKLSGDLVTPGNLDVTGTVTADGLTVDDVVSIDTSTGSAFSSTGNLKIDIDSDNSTTDRVFQITSDAEAKLLLQVKEGGDISFYEDTGTTPKFFWDASAESLGIGTSSPAGLLNLHSASGDSNLFITTGNTAAATNIFFGDTDNSSVGRIVYDHGSNYMNFRTNGSDAMRIDANGNLLVGTNSLAVSSSTGSVTGTVINSSGLFEAAKIGTIMDLNRLSTDGTILNFRKDGTTVGSISVYDSDPTGGGGELLIASGNTGLKFDDQVNYIRPSNGAGALRDNTIDLGKSDSRFKDLYTMTVQASTGTEAAPAYSFAADSNSGMYLISADNLGFSVGGAERMRCDSSGNLQVGFSSYSSLGSVNTGCRLSHDGQTNAIARGSNGVVLSFYSGNGGAGNISVTTNTAAYNTSSDQRLKENIADADDAGSKVDSIQVRKFDWKADGSHQDYGMVAQELQAVAPEAVSVPEDPEEMMGVDYSKLVPMMLKEIQSLRARIAALES
jgi:hypothetical protein